MAKYERGLEGTVDAGHPTKDRPGVGTQDSKYWVSHRLGPFQFHEVGKGCEPKPSDNAGYINDIANAIEQGFAPCPRCIKSKGGTD